MIRIGVAGAGWVSGHHLEAWRQLAERATVVAIADPDLAAGRSRADAFGIPAVYGSVDAMLDAESGESGKSINAIDVAAPREFHGPICRMAADRGLAILCQKPLAPTLDEAEELVAAVDGRCRLMVHENWRFRPHYRRIADWLGAGHIGDVRTVSLSLLTSGLLADADGQLPALVRQPMLATLDRMLVMEVLIHHVDTLRFLLGPLQLAGATLGRSCKMVRGEDRAALLLTTDTGAAVTIVGDFAAYGYPPQQRDQLEIFGTRGRVSLDGDRLRRFGAAGPRTLQEPEEDVVIDLAADYKASYLGALTHFLDRLADGRPFETGPEDNLQTLRIVEAAYRVGGGSVPSLSR